ncbi:MAG: hypothetical protein KAS70_07280, partial [Planctomycetes bacterium]|nr:hypothetical protein [Planctomycetota bacterium]
MRLKLWLPGLIIKIIIPFLFFTCYFFVTPARAEAPTQNQINQAVDKGAEYLKQQVDKGFIDIYDELVLLTLHWAGGKESEPQMEKLIKKAYSKGLIRTYTSAAMAMALESIDKRKHFKRIADCAQYLVDNQCRNGQWGYSENAKGLKSRPLPKDKKIKKKGTFGQKRKTMRRLKRGGGGSGDNSNLQFALLGLRSAERAGIRIPKKTWMDAVKWLVKKQKKNGGWAYDGYSSSHNESYGSMTCASLCSLAIGRYYLNKKYDYKKDRAVKKGLQWLTEKFTVRNNPGFTPGGRPPFGLPKSTIWLYYYIYGLERVGSIL